MLSVTAASLSDTRTSGGYSTSFPAASGQDTRIRPSGGRAPAMLPSSRGGLGSRSKSFILLPWETSRGWSPVN